MRAGEVRDLEDRGLAELVARSRQELFNLRFQHATGQLENTAALRRARRDLARGLTVARQRGVDVDGALRRSDDGG